MLLGIICIVGSLLLAFAAGWGMGRAVPSWDLDRANEDTSRFRRYGAGLGRGWGLGRFVHRHGGGCGAVVFQFMRSTGLTVVFAVGAVLLGIYGFDNTPELVSGDHPTLWDALSIVAVVGYIVSRITDKGPVGPLD